MPQISLSEIRITTPISAMHPSYGEQHANWLKWRRAYEGGRDFVNTYMVKLSSREKTEDFDNRKLIAYPPTFAKAAINDIKNAIFQRTADVARLDGPSTYMQAVKGLQGGVDLQGSAMGTYIGTEILAELLVMARVGVLIDAPSDIGTTMADKTNKQPFLSTYIREDIINWTPENPQHGYDSLLLRESMDNFDDNGLPTSKRNQWRLYERQENGVKVTFYDENGDPDEPIMLNLPMIPFVSFEIPLSLMEDVADYQVALLNLESSDISFAQKANFPIYYEFFDPRFEGEHFKPGGETIIVKIIH